VLYASDDHSAAQPAKTQLGERRICRAKRRDAVARAGPAKDATGIPDQGDGLSSVDKCPARLPAATAAWGLCRGRRERLVLAQVLVGLPWPRTHGWVAPHSGDGTRFRVQVAGSNENAAKRNLSAGICRARLAGCPDWATSDRFRNRYSRPREWPFLRGNVPPQAPASTNVGIAERNYLRRDSV